MPASEQHERSIRALVATSVAAFANGFETRHLSEVDDPDGAINIKVHNVFIAALGPDIQYYTALVRSFDSLLGNMLEDLAIGIARLSFDVQRQVAGVLSSAQTNEIARLLQAYKDHEKRPEIADYAALATLQGDHARPASHDSDYYLHDRERDAHYLIELKIGGDLDNKKARSEKEALLEQYAILANQLASAGSPASNVHVKFATAYNRYGEGRPWLQSRVRQFFADDELLIGGDFWNFVAHASNGYEIVIDEYKHNSQRIIAALGNVRHAYLHQ